MKIFTGNTESTIFVVERWGKNQNVQQEIPFLEYFNRFEVQLPVFALRAEMSRCVIKNCDFTYNSLLHIHKRYVVMQLCRDVINHMPVKQIYSEHITGHEKYDSPVSVFE